MRRALGDCGLTMWPEKATAFTSGEFPTWSNAWTHPHSAILPDKDVLCGRAVYISVSGGHVYKSFRR